MQTFLFTKRNLNREITTEKAGNKERPNRYSETYHPRCDLLQKFETSKYPIRINWSIHLPIEDQHANQSW